MCCIISGEPIEDSRENGIRTFKGPNLFQTQMVRISTMFLNILIFLNIVVLEIES